MNRYLPILSIVSAAVFLSSACTKEYDLCVYGGTASGIMAAYAAAEEGLDVVIVEPTERFGGLTAGGLGQTDIGNTDIVRGLALEFYRKIGTDLSHPDKCVFTPSSALRVFEEYLAHPGIKAVKGYHLAGVVKEGAAIKSIRAAKGADTLTFRAKWFIDSSYEGDLMAEAGVSYRTGREDNSEYGETWNGVQMLSGHQFPDGVDPYVVPGDPESGLLWGISDREPGLPGSGDGLIQAYNYRICLTDSLENMVPITEPENYDPSRYELLVRLYEAQPGKTGVNDYFIWSLMPGRKTDINNRGGFSTDMIGMNYDYPEASWERREQIKKAHKDYTLGLLYFTATDPRVPEALRREVARWGLPKDEYVESGHWTPLLYIRESRRMVGGYVATQADCEGTRTAPDPVALAAYTMDSHNCQRVVVHKDGKAMVKNEGNVEMPVWSPYPVSYRSMTPIRSECVNLLVPVCCSATHIAYGSIRMEPVFMCMGEAAGRAVAIAEKGGLGAVQDVDSRDIVARLK